MTPHTFMAQLLTETRAKYDGRRFEMTFVDGSGQKQTIFLIGQVSTVAYALINRADWGLAACFAGNAACCVAILAVAFWKRRDHARRAIHYPADRPSARRLNAARHEGSRVSWQWPIHTFHGAGR